MQFSGPPQTIESKQLASGGTLAQVPAGGAFTADAGGGSGGAGGIHEGDSDRMCVL